MARAPACRRWRSSSPPCSGPPFGDRSGCCSRRRLPSVWSCSAGTCRSCSSSRSCSATSRCSHRGQVLPAAARGRSTRSRGTGRGPARGALVAGGPGRASSCGCCRHCYLPSRTANAGRAGSRRARDLAASVTTIVDDLAEPLEAGPPAPDQAVAAGGRVLCVGARYGLDTAAAGLLAQLLRGKGLPRRWPMRAACSTGGRPPEPFDAVCLSSSRRYGAAVCAPAPAAAARPSRPGIPPAYACGGVLRTS